AGCVHELLPAEEFHGGERVQALGYNANVGERVRGRTVYCDGSANRRSFSMGGLCAGGEQPDSDPDYFIRTGTPSPSPRGYVSVCRHYGKCEPVGAATDLGRVPDLASAKEIRAAALQFCVCGCSFRPGRDRFTKGGVDCIFLPDPCDHSSPRTRATAKTAA